MEKELLDRKETRDEKMWDMRYIILNKTAFGLF